MTPDSKDRVSVHLPAPLLERLDSVARRHDRTRAQIIRQAIECYLEDFDDLTAASERLRDPTDPVLDWDQVRRGLLR